MSFVNRLYLFVLGVATVAVGIYHFRTAPRRAAEAATAWRRLPINGVIAWRVGAVIELCIAAFFLVLALFPL